jgi:flagellar biogenesis protein FliO
MIRLCAVFLCLCVFSSVAFSNDTNKEAFSAEKEIKLVFPMKEKAELPSLTKISSVLFLSIVLIFGVVFFLKRYFYPSSTVFKEHSSIQLISSKRITTKLSAHHIKMNEQSYLIVDKGDAISVTVHLTKIKEVENV